MLVRLERMRWEAFGRYPLTQEWEVLLPAMNLDPLRRQFPKHAIFKIDNTDVRLRGKPSGADKQVGFIFSTSISSARRRRRTAATTARTC